MRGRKWLTFTLDGRDYCTEAERVRKVRTVDGRLVSPRRGFALGRFKLSDGAELEMIDLKARLGLGPTCMDERKIVIVLGCAAGLVGLVVDDAPDIVQSDDVALADSGIANDRFSHGVVDMGAAQAMWLDVERVAAKRAELSAV